jgi:oligoribonuclease
MRHIFSLDIETTGLNPETCQVLEVACIAWDLDNPDMPIEGLHTFHTYVLNELPLRGEPFAFSMHPEILRRIANGDPGFTYTPASQVAEDLAYWMKGITQKDTNKQQAHGHFAGKNFGAFDLQFLRRLPNWSTWIRAAHRSYDPAVLYFDPVNDDRLPDMDTCCKRAGLLESRDLESGTFGNSLTTKHDAIGDARIVIQLLKAKFFPALRET